MSKKVIIGISGGVDSSVAAYLLKSEGYEVIGITFLFTDSNECEDAKKVCSELGIEHVIVDYRSEFKKRIIDNFINDYKKGITPNPCVICNRDVKVKLLYDYMIEYKCDYLATGHYAKITDDGLFVSEDLNKDQTYFLSQVPKYILDKLLLPLEGITKDKVREIAISINLSTATKKDSLDVCFIKNGFQEFIDANIEQSPGDVIEIKSNKVVGTHVGLSRYTIGQRKGLNIGGMEDRMFVVGKDMDKNILYVSTGSDTDYLISDECLVTDVNYLSDEKYDSCSARFRYRQILCDVSVTWIDDKNILVKYPNGVKAVTPGQACVLYKDGKCLGGGIIKNVLKKGEKLWYL